MTSLKPVSYSPIAKNQALYNELYALYRLLHDAFGGEPLSDLVGIFCNLF